MTLDMVLKDISESARASVRAIQSEADTEISKIVEDASSVISDMKKKEDKRLKEAVEQLGRQEISSAELESKKIVLSKKKEILSRAFAEALAALESAPASTRKKQYKKMVEVAEKAIGKPKAYCAKGESMTAEDIGAKSLTKVDSISGGLILESEDGQTQVDMQYKTILQTMWDSEMKNMSDILFR